VINLSQHYPASKRIAAALSAASHKRANLVPMANVWQKFVILRIIASPRNLYDRLVGRDDAAENDIDIDDPFAADETHCHPTAIFHAVHHGDDALFKRRVRSSKALASGWNKWQRYRITIELIAGGE
jgi:hypothetical protein